MSQDSAAAHIGARREFPRLVTGEASAALPPIYPFRPESPLQDGGLLMRINDRLHVGPIPLEAYHQVDYDLPGGKFTFTASDRSPVHVVGPLYFVGMQELLVDPYEEFCFQIKRLKRCAESYCSRLFLNDEFRSRCDSIHCLHPSSAVPGKAVNNYTAAVVASMLSTKEHFKDGLTIDAGASFNPTVSLTAGLSLGARKVLMVEKSEEALREGFAIARTQSECKLGGDDDRFVPIQGNLRWYWLGIQRRLEKEIANSPTPVVVVMNLGPTYGKVNEAALRFFASQENVSLIINGGYNLFWPSHEQELTARRSGLENWGFKVDELRCRRYTGTLIAQRH